MSGPVLSTSTGTRFGEPIGWPLLAVPDANGRLAFPDLAASVRQRIEVILRTAPGEQLMRPEFGVGLERLLHQPDTLTLRSEVAARIGEQLAAFEPRIIIDRILAEEGREPTLLSITIAYRLRATGAAGQISAQVPLGAA